MRGAIPPTEVARLTDACHLDDKPGARHGPFSSLYRAVESCSLTKTLRRHWPLVQMTRLVSFNKSARTNWQLPWHQDRVIAMAEKIETPGYGKWSRKSGIWHCEPPLAVLEAMLFVRVHLDDAEAEQGAMEIAVGSHRAGRVSKSRAADIAARYPCEVTTAKAGDVLVLAMLTLHRSATSTVSDDRRTLRVDYTTT